MQDERGCVYSTRSLRSGAPVIPISPSTAPRVAFWIGSLGASGITTSIVRVANALSCQGIKVDLVLSRHEGPYTVDHAVRIIDLNLGSGHHGRALFWVIRYVLNERPDVICVPSGPGYLLAALIRLARARTRVWISVRSTKQHRQLARVMETRGKGIALRIRRSVVSFGYRVSQRAFIHMPEGFIANSTAAAADFARNLDLKRSRIRVIYNACLTEKDLLPSSEQNSDNGQEGTIAKIASVGRLSTVKAFDVLIRAFDILRFERPAKLIIVGDGPVRSQLTALVDELGLSDNVELAGFKLEPFSYLGNADLFVLSSQTEPFGNALVEAMACGWPVVSTDCVGPREILDNGRYGPLVPVGDHVALAATMAEVLENPPDSQVLRTRALEFDADKIATQYREAFGV